MTQKEIDKFLANTKVYVNGKYVITHWMVMPKFD